MLKLFLLLLAAYCVVCVPLESSPEGVNVDDDDISQDETPQYKSQELNNIQSILTAAMKTSDPIYAESIIAQLSTLNYTLGNVNIRGLKKCVVNDAQINQDALTLNFQWECPKFYVDGQYKTKGTVLILPVEGNGEFNVRFGKYQATINANLVKYQDKNGQSRLKIKNFSFGPVDYLDPITYYATNLFDGDTKLADEAIKFFNDNWRDVATVIQEPVLNAGGKQLLKNVNLQLKRAPIENVIN